MLWGVCAAGQSLLTAPVAQNFGQVSANTAPPKTQTFSYAFSGSVFPTFSLHYALDYSISSAACSGSGSISCSVTVAFAPRFPGLRQDAVIVKNSAGAVLAETFLAGTGMGPQSSVFPGVISTVAGNGTWGYAGDGGLAASALLRNPQGIVADHSGNLFIADSLNQVVREVNAQTGRISTVAGTALGAGYGGDGGLATRAHLSTPCGIALDGAGNLFIADQGNNVIRRVDVVTQMITTVAGGGASASGVDGLGDGLQATRALLNGPSDVAVDAAGNLFISDSMHGLIRKVDATGVITVYAGGGTSSGTDGLGDGGPARQASLRDPLGMGLDAAGNLFIADSENGKVRRVDATSGIITALATPFTTPSAVRVDPAGNVYVADSAQNVVSQMNAAGGILIAGTVAALYTGDGGPANLATLSSPSALALDANGNIYISDYANNAIRKITVQPPTLTFSTTLVGQVSPSQGLQIMNTGNQNLVFSGLIFSSSFPQLLNGFSDCSAPSALAAGGFCNIGLQFVPLKTGLNSGSLLLQTNSLNFVAVQNFNLSGTGAAGAVPQLSMNTANLAFGNQTIGTSSAAQIVTITNRGTAVQPAFNAYASGSNDFTYGGNCGSPLGVGASCQVSIVFTPSGVGTRSASLTLNTGLANVSQISVTGIGVGAPQVAFNVNVLTFNNQPAGSTSPSQTVTVSNAGGAPLNIINLALTGPNATNFSITHNCGNSVAANSSCYISVTFSPSALGSRIASINLASNASGSPKVLTMTGNGGAQIHAAIWRPSNGMWFVLAGTNGSPTATQWGGTGDIPVPGDYDGDGKTDIAVFRPSTGSWYIVSSLTGAGHAQTWGASGDIPVPGDYDGDGKTDIAVFRPSTGSWYIVSSLTGAGHAQTWGASGDIPVPGDYDGDGKTDIAVFRPSGVWIIIPSRTGVGYAQNWGAPGDIPVPADYDGDGKTDIAVFRMSGGWIIIPSHTGVGYVQNWGAAGDTPVSGDYDGDGKADIAVYRPSNQTWYVIPSATGNGFAVQFGLSGDLPLGNFHK